MAWKQMKWWFQGGYKQDSNLIWELYDSDKARVQGINSKGHFIPLYDDVFPGGVWTTKVGASAPGTTVITPVALGYSHPVKAFDGVTTAEEMSNTIEIIHGIDIDNLNNESLKAEWHVHVGKSNTADGTALFIIQPTYLYANGDIETLPVIPIYCSFGFGSVYSNLTFGTEFPKPSKGFNIGDNILFNILRDPTDVEDTYGYDVILYQTALHMPFDGNGSEQRYIKN